MHLNAVMDRDRRLTGFLRGQTDNPKAPAGFELSNPWRVSVAIRVSVENDKTNANICPIA